MVRARGCDALRLALTACLLRAYCAPGVTGLSGVGGFVPIVQMRKQRLRKGK